MDYSSVFAEGGNEVSQEKPPRRVCPRCNSTNTKFCYYNNHSVSQQRYRCKDCRRKWTHGGALRNIPIGGNGRKKKSRRIDQPSASQLVSAGVQQVSRRHQPFSHAQETNQFVGTFGGTSSSSGIDFGNQIGSFPDTHGNVVLPFQSFPPTDRSYFHDGLFQRDYYNVQSNDMIGNHLNNQSTGNYLNNQSTGNHLINQSTGNHLNNQSIGNHLINQSIGSYNVVHSDQNSYINKEDQNKWNHQSLNNTMNMNHNASTSGIRESWDTDHMNKNNGNIKNNCVYKSYYHMENHGP